MNRIDVFVRRQRIKNLENWTIRAIWAEAFFLPIFPSLAAAAVMFGITFWFFRLQIDTKFKIRSLPFDIPVSIFIMLGAISVFNSPARDFELIYNYCAVGGVYGLTYLLVGQNIRTAEQIKDLAKVLAASAVIVALGGYFQYIFGIDLAEMTWADGELHPELRKYVFSTMENPNVLAGYLDAIICLALGFLAKFGSRREKFILLGAIIFFAACLAMTHSHGAFLSLAIIFLFYGFLQDWRFLTLLALIIGVVYYNDANFFEKVMEIFTAPNDFSEIPRTAIWVSTISMIADHPFVGIGWGAYEMLFPQYNYYLTNSAATINHAHNLYLQTAAEIGIAGALSYFWYFFGTMFTALTSNSKTADGESKFQKLFNEQLIKTFSTSKFLQELAQAKSMLMLRMADLSNKILDKFSPQKEQEPKKPAKKSEPELVHHDELKFSSKKKSKDDKKSDDDNFDVQKFADDSLFETETERLTSDKKFVEGLKFGIGLAFLSMALNGMSDDLLFNIPSSMLMWLLGALGVAITLIDDEN
ncbi:MAG: O-antigen ligase family protein [Selenomonadaceae bacterium]|nr:O-antigen ligase family protein [Selenomonadaceae bacterium]